jgi:ubiquinone/menaquinone biosynthesis C-methylase UbiE
LLLQCATQQCLIAVLLLAYIKNMNVQEAYNNWSHQYDTNHNKTRDLEAVALQTTLSNMRFDNCLEIGCGTGKNTSWLLTRATAITAIDISEAMLAKAKEKITNPQVQFIQADITAEWLFANKQYQLVTCSLVLEHIENLESVFKKIASATDAGALVYIGELHPFKQYNGSKARYETENGVQIVTCFNHHITDFTLAATANGFELLQIHEFFDDDNRMAIPRILSLLFRKK